MSETEAETKKPDIRTLGLLLAGLLAGVVVFSAVAYAGAVPGLTPSVTVQIEFQDIALKIEDVSGELGALRRVLATHDENLGTLRTDIGTDVGEILSRIGEPTSDLFGMIGDLRSVLDDALMSIASLQTEVETVGASLDPGGEFYAFMEGWFTATETAITDAERVIVEEIGANEAKLDALEEYLLNTFDGEWLDFYHGRLPALEELVGEGLLGETEGILVECPGGLGESPCDGATPINTLGVYSDPRFELAHPKRVSLWVWGAVEEGDVFKVRASVFFPQEGVTGCGGDIYWDTILGEVAIDATNSETLILAYGQLPVPCGVYFVVERTGSFGGDSDPLRFVVVVEEV